MTPPRILPAICLVLLCHHFAAIDAFGESLALRIDQLVESGQPGPVAAQANDAEFLRRATLDLNGTIPTSSEATAFLDDQSPNKRELLIDRLLSSPRFGIHMARVFDVMFMERRPDKHVTTAEWQKYLQSAFEKNVPFNQLAREILSADGEDSNLRPAAKFFLDRDAEPNVMTRDVGRIFFGMDLQCAQCHDSPLVEHYLQTDYFGLFAFVNRTVVFTDETTKKSFLGEKSDGEATYKSVFTQDAGQIRPQLPGDDEIDEPRFRQGEDYLVAPLPGSRPVPKYSRRSKLAELATSGLNRQFNANIANRLWAHLMGRGLVHPVDLHHPLNPPTQPAVLELIASEFASMKYDTRGLLRELAMTKTYQRSIDPPATEQIPSFVLTADRISSLTAEQTALQAVATESRKIAEAAQTEFKAARATLVAAETAWRTAETAVTAAKKPIDDLSIAIAKAEADAKTKQAVINAVNDAAAKSAEAAKLLPNDKEIASAVATFTAKQQQLATELATVQKTIADQMVAQALLQLKLVEAYVPADAAYAAYVEARKPVDAAKTRLIAAWNQHKADSLLAAARKKQLDGHLAHIAFQSSQSSVATARGLVDSRKTELALAAGAVEEMQIQLAAQTVALGEIGKSVTETGKLMEDAKSQFSAKQSVVQAVAEALAKTDVALQKLPGDAELTLAAQKLKERLEPLVKEAATLEQAVANREAAMNEVAARQATSKQTLAITESEMANRRQSVADKSNEVNQSIAAVQSAESSVESNRKQLVELWTVSAGVRVVKQVSPEQMTWAIMQATGVLDGEIANADAEVEKTIPKATGENDVAQARLRELKVEQRLNEQMRGHASTFVGLYGASPGQPQEDFFATPDQALFAANGGAFNGWAAGGRLSQRLAPLTDAKAFADELYLSLLTRRPTDIEVNEATQYVASRPNERPQAIRELIWSLLTSAEFRFNH